MNQKIKTSNTRSGSGLIFAVVLLFVILGMVVTLSSVTVLETKMNQKTKSSVGAFYNADSGVEWALNKIAANNTVAINTAFPDFSVNKTPCPSGFNCDIYFLDKDGKVIITNLTVDQIKAVRAVGTQGTGETTQRAIEAAVAQSACGVYPAPCDVKLTTATHNGNFGGYQGIYSFVQSDSNCGSAYHACDVTEITRYAQLHSLPSTASTGGAFVITGLAYVGGNAGRPISECKSWTDSGVENGPILIDIYGYNHVEVANCSNPYPVMCCK